MNTNLSVITENLLSAKEEQSTLFWMPSSSSASPSASSSFAWSSSGSVTSSDSGKRRGEVVTTDAPVNRERQSSRQTQWAEAAVSVGLLFSWSLNRMHIRRGCTWTATFPLVRVFPVEGLVVFDAIGYSVAAGAGFVARATTHPTQFNSRHRQHMVLLWITGWSILWRKPERELTGSKGLQNNH